MMSMLQLLRSGRLIQPLRFLKVSLWISIILSLWLYYRSGSIELLGLNLLLWGTLLSLFILMRRLKQKVFEPIILLENSVARVSQGEPGASLRIRNTGILCQMVKDIDSMSEELTELYEDMDSRIGRHTTRLAQKTASLKILYDVAASINEIQDLDELLMRFLRSLKEMVNGQAISVRIIQNDGSIRLVGTIGTNDQLLQENELLPLKICACGQTLSPGDILCHHGKKYCADQGYLSQDEIEVLSVPLAYRNQLFGEYLIYVPPSSLSQREDIIELIQTIGHHLGMAIAKHRSDQEAHRLSILEERNALAHELHDSLAQTLASLRYQIRILEDTLEQEGICPMAQKDLYRIRHGMDEAHTELRTLLNSFRAPVNGHDLILSIEKLVHHFSSETGIATYFQKDCHGPKLPSFVEMQILRIVQESLTNIRKHAQAHTVRVLLSCQSGLYHLLIEDDGIGFDSRKTQGHPGEHIGLSIMEERAQRIGGELKIETEKGEGTRIELYYRPSKNKKHRWIE